MSATANPLVPLRQFGVEASRVAPARRGGLNQRWEVTTAGGPLVLRRYNPIHLPEGIVWEHELLRWLSGRGWPVTVPLPAPNGDSCVPVGEEWFALFPAPRGRPFVTGSVTSHRIAGRLLGRFHRDVADFPVAGQRPGYGRVWELDLLVERLGVGSFNQLVRRFGEDHWELASRVRAQRYRNLRELSRGGYGDLGDSVVHTGFHAGNLLSEQGTLTGLEGLDGARLDTRAYDVAVGLLSDTLRINDEGAVDARAAAAFVDGYSRRGALDGVERALIPALARAHLLWTCACYLIDWRQTGSGGPVERLAAVVRGWLPALDRAAPALSDAVSA